MVAAGPLVIITTRSDSSTASSTSWVIIITVLPRRAWISITLSCRWARVRASSAPNGSSISSTLGCMASARAMPTRCFMPPETSCGRLSLACAICTSSRLCITQSWRWLLLFDEPNTLSTAMATLP
jgi:hypothetical protein